jgi:hypothetical protein
MVSKYTRIGDEQEEKAFFNRQVYNVITAYIPWVKTPYAPSGKQHIPFTEKECCYNCRNKEVLPLLVEVYFFVKCKNKRYHQAAKVNQQINVLIRHLLACFFERL